MLNIVPRAFCFWSDPPYDYHRHGMLSLLEVWLPHEPVCPSSGCSLGRSVKSSYKGRKLHLHAPIGALVNTLFCQGHGQYHSRRRTSPSLWWAPRLGWFTWLQHRFGLVWFSWLQHRFGNSKIVTLCLESNTQTISFFQSKKSLIFSNLSFIFDIVDNTK